MALKISFNLKSGNSENAQLIASLSFGYKEYDELKKTSVYKPLRFYTDMRIKRSHWSQEDRLPMDPVARAKAIELGRKIQYIYDYLSMKGDVTLELFKDELEEKINGKTAERVIRRVRIVDFILQDVMQTAKLTYKSKQAYLNVARKLEDFEKQIGKPLFTNDVDAEMYMRFMEAIQERLNRRNAVWSVMKTFKSTLNRIARKYKIKVFNPSNELASSEKVSVVSTNSIYLNFDHVAHIIRHVPKNETMANVKLILLTLIFTGCRESDVYKIRPEHFHEAGQDSFYYARYFSQKTDTEIIVPILKPLLEAYECNDWNPPRKIPQQTFNNYVKEFILDCGLNHEVILTYTDSFGKKQHEKKPFNEFVSSHIGRRSFVTNLINHVPITLLTKITGHSIKDKSIIFEYNKMTLLENAILLRDQLRYAMEKSPKYFPIALV